MAPLIVRYKITFFKTICLKCTFLESIETLSQWASSQTFNLWFSICVGEYVLGGNFLVSKGSGALMCPPALTDFWVDSAAEARIMKIGGDKMRATLMTLAHEKCTPLLSATKENV